MPHPQPSAMASSTSTPAKSTPSTSIYCTGDSVPNESSVVLKDGVKKVYALRMRLLMYDVVLVESQARANYRQAMLTMSDFQLITGLSILISGFTQLDTGISAYHWQRLVQLAWFSSITHLCTLTALRSYFRHHIIGYFWRLPGMIILILMLIVALIPTGHYTWGASIMRYAMGQEGMTVRPQATDSATCYFNSHVGICPDYTGSWMQGECDHTFEAAQQRMILSAVFLGVGMCNRLWHLFRLPSRVFNSTRSFCSNCSMTVLSQMYVWTREWPMYLAFPFTLFVYYMALTIFLTIRLLADMLTSRAFEVRSPVCDLELIVDMSRCGG